MIVEVSFFAHDRLPPETTSATLRRLFGVSAASLRRLAELDEGAALTDMS